MLQGESQDLTVLTKGLHLLNLHLKIQNTKHEGRQLLQMIVSQIVIKIANWHATEGLQVQTVILVKKGTMTDQAETIEHLNVEENILWTRANQNLFQKGAGHIRNAPGQNPEILEDHGRDHIREVVIREGLVVGLVRGLSGHIPSRDVLRLYLVINLQHHVILDLDQDISVLVPEVHILETREDLVQDVDRAPAVAGHITTAGLVPLAAVGVRGRTDIEMPRIMQVVFLDCFCMIVYFLY